MWLFIEPVDVWLFRDGRPFTGGEDHVARTIFPPSPFTLQGAIRARILAERGVDLADYAKGESCADSRSREVGTEIGFPGTGYGKLQLRGPFLARRENGRIVRYYRVPADLRRLKAPGSSIQVVALAPKKEVPFATNLPSRPLRLLWSKVSEALEEASGWLSDDEMRKYLAGDCQRIRVAGEHSLLQYENRFGISVDSSLKRTEEGMLYQVQFVRLAQGVGLLVSVDGVSVSPRGKLALGGENRAAFYEKVDWTPGDVDIEVRSQALAEKRFKLVLTTPAYFHNGWCPSDLSVYFTGSKPTLVAAAIPKPVCIGGAKVDFESQRRGSFQKPMYSFVPAGAVYFFETDGEVRVVDKPFTESPKDDDFGRIGFGQFLIGRWHYV